MEDALKKCFNEKFVRHDDGYEYIIGHPMKMARLIFEASGDEYEETFKTGLLAEYYDNQIFIQDAESEHKEQSNDCFDDFYAADDAYNIDMLFDSPSQDFRKWVDEWVIKIDEVISQIEWYKDYSSYCFKKNTLGDQRSSCLFQTILSI